LAKGVKPDGGAGGKLLTEVAPAVTEVP